MKIDKLAVLNTIAQTIFDKKGVNILALDVRDICTIADYFIIAEGSADRHVVAIAKSIYDAMNERGIKPIHIEGLHTGDWVVMDFHDIIIHLFSPGIREKYSLEQVWQKSKIVNVVIDIT